MTSISSEKNKTDDKSLNFERSQRRKSTKGLESTWKTEKIRTSTDAALEDWDVDSCAENGSPGKRFFSRSNNFVNQRRKDHKTINNSTKIKCEDTEHFQTYKKIFNFFVKLGIFYGVELNYHWQPRRYIRWHLVVIVAILAWVFVFYTQALHINNGEILKAVEPFAIYGIASSGVLKIFCYLKRRYAILSLLFSTAPICRRNVSGIRADIIKRHLTKAYALLKLFCCGLFSCAVMFVLGPIKEYFANKVFTSLLPLEFFFIDQSTVFGYLTANIIVTIMGFYAVWGSVLYTSSFIMFISNYDMLVELIHQDFKDLDEMWSGGSIISNSYKRAYLKNTCKKCQDLGKFLKVIKEIYDMKLFIYFIFNYFSQIICLFEITLNNWAPGYGIATCLFLEMMFYCFMGSRIPLANQRLCGIICESNWYTFDKKSQRMILMLLHHCQHFHELRLGPIGPLNLVTGIEIVKSIFSYYIVLKELF